jgi:hypothetical protein
MIIWFIIGPCFVAPEVSNFTTRLARFSSAVRIRREFDDRNGDACRVRFCCLRVKRDAVGSTLPLRRDWNVPEALSPWFPHPAKNTNPPIASMIPLLKSSSSNYSDDAPEYHACVLTGTMIARNCLQGLRCIFRALGVRQ